VVAATLALLLTVPTFAAAKGSSYLVPPGQSAASQYLETVPSAAGAKEPNSGGKPGATLPAGEAKRLDDAGASGRLLVSVVAATAPAGLARRGAPSVSRGGAGHAGRGTRHTSTGPVAGSGGAGSNRGGPSGGGTSKPRAAGGVSPTGAVVAAATGQDAAGGLGTVALVLAAVALLGVALVGLARGRRSRGT
jgi:hypothetical protein